MEPLTPCQPLSGLKLRTSSRGLSTPASSLRRGRTGELSTPASSLRRGRTGELTAAARDVQLSARCRTVEVVAASTSVKLVEGREDTSKKASEPCAAAKMMKSLAISTPPVSARSWEKAFRSPDRGLKFGRKMAARVSLGPMDKPQSDGSDSGEEEEEDEPLTPLMVPGEDSLGNFAQRMLLVCRRVAIQAREEGPNIMPSDSSVSPTKSPSKRGKCGGASSANTSPMKCRRRSSSYRRRAWHPPEDMRTPERRYKSHSPIVSREGTTPGMALDRILSEHGLVAERGDTGTLEGL